MVSFGAFLLFQSLKEKLKSRFPEFSENFELRGNLSFSFRSGISRSEIENFPTEDHEGVQIGSGGNPDSNERRRELSEFFLIHRMFRSSFVARKQRIFDGIHNHRTMDGGKNPQAKTEPKERNFCFLTFGSAGFSRKSVLTEKKWKNFSHPPTPFCAPMWAALFRPWSGESRSD